MLKKCICTNLGFPWFPWWNEPWDGSARDRTRLLRAAEMPVSMKNIKICHFHQNSNYSWNKNLSGINAVKIHLCSEEAKKLPETPVWSGASCWWITHQHRWRTRWWMSSPANNFPQETTKNFCLQQQKATRVFSCHTTQSTFSSVVEK